VTWSSAPPSVCSSSSRGRRLGVLVGWRAWRVVARAAGLRLSSAVFDAVWEPGRPLGAGCSRGHAAPTLGCACGIYGVRAPADAVRYLVGRDDPDVVHRVLGQVALWGVTVEAERGWRAEYASPSRLLVPAGRTDRRPVEATAVASTLAEAYAVPAEILAADEPRRLARALAA
jgi:hypothetical protein